MITKKNFFSASNTTEFKIPTNQLISTSGSSSYSPFFGSFITEQARSVLRKEIDPNVGKNLQKVISIIDNILDSYVATGNETSNIQPIKAAVNEDGSVALDWISPDYRLGFSIEKEFAESGWYLATTKRINEMGGYGHFSDQNNKEITSLLINFLFSNS